jgi:putative transposase
MARLLEVSRSGFYAWAKRLPSKRAVRAERIEAKIAWFQGESDEVSGAPRILADLREDGERISPKTVAKTMRKLGLRGGCPRQWCSTTQRDSGDTYPPDAAKRQWDTGVLNAVWVGDITYLRTWEGWLYLATVIDACSRRVIGWAIADHMRTDLVQDALKMAITLRGELHGQVVFHTDRGTQYASAPITEFAAENGITRSMGFTGICWDNAMAESFFATWKTEFYYRRAGPPGAAPHRQSGHGSRTGHDRRRRHSSIGQISPVALELQHCNQTAAAAEAA